MISPLILSLLTGFFLSILPHKKNMNTPNVASDSLGRFLR